jgi:hypothetical protein
VSGPRDYLLVEFPDHHVPADLVPGLSELVGRGVIRILDLIYVRKDAAGRVSWFELEVEDPTDAPSLAELRSGLVGLLSEDDVAGMTSGLARSSSAGLLIWENTWTAPLENTIRRAGARVLAQGRIQGVVSEPAGDGKGPTNGEGPR